ncbi:MAG: motility protein A [Halanaerobiales bacterium]
MDFSTVLGVVAGTLLVGGAIITQEGYQIFFSLESLMIVVGGTVAGTMISYSFGELKKIPSLIKISLQNQNMDSSEIIDLLVDLAEKARREGLLALEQDVAEVDDNFLQQGIQLVVDGTDPELVRNILETKLTFLEERHNKGRNIFSTMGKLSPAFGMIGTLIGLIQMLTQLENPDTLGPGMAIALITTLYGTLMANMIFIPLSGKLQMRSEEEILMKEVMIEGILSIQAGENPRIVEEKLKAFLAGDEESESENATEVEEEMAVGENAQTQE